jgi:hypothetical protein
MSDRWEILDHVCRHCAGRCLRRVDADGVEIIRCSDCGAEVHGEYRELCFCGALPEGFKTALKCSMNSPTPECPAEVVAVEVVAP